MPSAPKFNRFHSQRSMHGAAMTEMVVVLAILLPFVLGTWQTALIFNAKAILNNATFEAARTGAVENGRRQPIRYSFIRNMIPLYGGGSGAVDVFTRYRRAQFDIDGPITPMRLDVISPSQEAFRDFGVRRNGRTVVPNDNLRYRNVNDVRSRSGVNIQDANLLKIRVTYGYRLTVPLVNRIIRSAMLFIDPRNAAYYLQDPPRLPLVAQATVRMQSDAYEDGNMSVPNGGP